MNNLPLMSLYGINKVYNKGFVALDSLNLDIQKAEVLVVRGPSGSGKSSLISIMSGLMSPTSGKVTFAGEDIFRVRKSKLSLIRRENFGFVFQDYNLMPDFNVYENVFIACLLRSKNKKASVKEAIDLIDRLGLSNKRWNLPRELSGGESQRVAIARAVVNRPKIVFADEPTGNLDRENREEIYSMLEEINKDFGSAIVIVTHDEGLKFKSVDPRILFLEKGRLVC